MTLLWSIMQSKRGLWKTLMNHGVSVHDRYIDGESPIDFACRTDCDFDTYKKILSRAKVEQLNKTGPTRLAPIHVICITYAEEPERRNRELAKLKKTLENWCRR